MFGEFRILKLSIEDHGQQLNDYKEGMLALINALQQWIKQYKS